MSKKDKPEDPQGASPVDQKHAEAKAKVAEDKAQAAEAAAAKAEAAVQEAARKKLEETRAREAAADAVEEQIKVVDRQAKRRAAIVKQIQSFRFDDEEMKDEPVGIWKSEDCIRRLRLDRLPKGTILIKDVVPMPGCSTNGVVFAPGSTQLLPEWLWDDIDSRCDARMESERKFLYPKAEVELEKKTYSDKAKSPLGRLASILDKR